MPWGAIYAKNVIQYIVDEINIGKDISPLKYRDELTEGYNVTPNFFISALVDPDYNFNIDGLQAINADNPEVSCHFKNRLFDRDTLIVHRYQINFLYVLSAYVARGATDKINFKNRAKKTFRDNLISYFGKHYHFYEIAPIGMTIEEFAMKYFNLLMVRFIDLQKWEFFNNYCISY